ncbi:MAG: rhomboid family intramembrane serine protease [Treponema sp.]|nr:rhomboid family intramembrane serine protease [Candidatus Treponema merdequi]
MTNFLQKKFRYTYFHATAIITVINILVYILTSINKAYTFYFALNPSAVIDLHMYWQLFTCTFIHHNIKHLFFNMFGFLMFGMYVEKSIGSKEFLLYFFICGIFSNALSLLVYVLTGYWNVFLMGASGIVFSILFAFAVIFPTVKVFLFGIIPIPAPVLVLLYTVIEIFSQVFGINSNVAHMTHLFGFLSAWLYFVIRFGINPVKIWKNALKH